MLTSLGSERSEDDDPLMDTCRLSMLDTQSGFVESSRRQSMQHVRAQLRMFTVESIARLDRTQTQSSMMKLLVKRRCVHSASVSFVRSLQRTSGESSCGYEGKLVLWG